MVEFFETDMAGIMHFSNFFRFMEAAEHAFYRSIGFSVDEAKSLDSAGPRQGGMRIPAPAALRTRRNSRQGARLGTRSITLEFQFSKTEEGREISVATGAITAVCVERDPKTGGFRSVPIPEKIRARIQADANF
jgi:acyl-CoA thioesterase FadM